MADVKFTGLPAGSGIPDNGSLVAISTYDGVSAYTSEKYTMTQLKDIVYVMEAEDKISFDSSGTNKVFVDDSNSNFRMELDAYGGGQVVISDDGNGATSDFSKSWIYFDGSFSWFGYGQAGGSNGSSLIVGEDSGTGFNQFYANGKDYFYANPANYVTPNTINPNVSISSQNNTMNGHLYNNSVAIGGNGLTIDKSGYLFSGKHECQLATETFSFEDAGSVGATEQDWIEVSVGGVTGYIRVFATK